MAPLSLVFVLLIVGLEMVLEEGVAVGDSFYLFKDGPKQPPHSVSQKEEMEDEVAHCQIGWDPDTKCTKTLEDTYCEALQRWKACEDGSFSKDGRMRSLRQCYGPFDDPKWAMLSKCEKKKIQKECFAKELECEE